MPKLKASILTATTIGGLLTVGSLMPKRADAEKPTDVAIVSSVPLTVSGNVAPVLPANAFTHPPSQVFLVPSGAAVPPDPSGTRYAISAFVVSNPTSVETEVTLRAKAGTTSASCSFLFNEVANANGPKMTVQPHSTGSLTFPVPYVTDAVAGPQVCLTAAGNNTTGMNWSAVGYKILP